jgi:hypothetical protein
MKESSGVEPADLAAGSLDDQDAQILRAVATMYSELDPVPPGMIERMQFAITLEALDAEVASLQRLDALAGARGTSSDVQTVTFTSTSLTTMVTISPTGIDRVRIDGWAAPGGGLSVELRVGGEQLSVVADSDGRFVFEDAPRGLARFVLRSPTSLAAPVVTPALEI